MGSPKDLNIKHGDRDYKIGVMLNVKAKNGIIRTNSSLLHFINPKKIILISIQETLNINPLLPTYFNKQININFIK